jgi:hypothetical protein
MKEFCYGGGFLCYFNVFVGLQFRNADFQFLGVRYLSKVIYDVEVTMM